MNSGRIYISKEKLNIIKRIIEDLQKRGPYEAVTKKLVQKEIKRKQKEVLLTNKTVSRAFKRLTGSRWLLKERRGQYWLPEYYDNSLKNLKETIKSMKGRAKLATEFLDALIYCDSGEDLALLGAFFAKMRENKYEKEQVELEEYDQELKAKIMDQIEKERKISIQSSTKPSEK